MRRALLPRGSPWISRYLQLIALRLCAEKPSSLFLLLSRTPSRIYDCSDAYVMESSGDSDLFSVSLVPIATQDPKQGLLLPEKLGSG